MQTVAGKNSDTRSPRVGILAIQGDFAALHQRVRAREHLGKLLSGLQLYIGDITLSLGIADGGQ